MNAPHMNDPVAEGAAIEATVAETGRRAVEHGLLSGNDCLRLRTPSLRHSLG